MAFPNYESFDYSFGRAELQINRNIFTGVKSVQFSQPTEEGVIKGTKPWPLGRTEGEMGLGDGTLGFTSESERIRLFDILGDGYRQKIFLLNWTLVSPRAPTIRLACLSCRILDNPIDHATGVEALAGEVKFSFMTHTINGKRPHIED